MHNLLDALRTKIATSGTGSGFAALFSGRVYLDSAAGDDSLPLCVYTGAQNRYERAFDSTLDTVNVTFSIYEPSNQCYYGPTGSARLKTLLDGAELTATGYARAVVYLRQRGVPVFADDVWTTSDVYEIVGFVKG